MSEEIKGFNSAWLAAHAAETAGDGSAYLLIQGYPSTGFSRIQNRALEFRLYPAVDSIEDSDWDYYFDVRMFGELGEWHCWRAPSLGWRGRLAKTSEWQNSFDRSHVLWGTRFEKQDSWWQCAEGRGAQIWVPALLNVSAQRPGALRVRQKVEFDQDGLAGVTDAMVLAIEEFKHERPL
jgi:CRISPR-associated protein (TIGR03984 family)